jgi:hypothetical protein
MKIELLFSYLWAMEIHHDGLSLFYDNKSAREVMGKDQLRELAVVLFKKVKTKDISSLSLNPLKYQGIAVCGLF